MPFYLIHYADPTGAPQIVKEAADDQTDAEVKATQIVADLGGTLVRVVNITLKGKP